MIARSNHPEVLCKKNALKNFEKSTGFPAYFAAAYRGFGTCI